jgi:hypothetical protein
LLTANGTTPSAGGSAAFVEGARGAVQKAQRVAATFDATVVCAWHCVHCSTCDCSSVVGASAVISASGWRATSPRAIALWVPQYGHFKPPESGSKAVGALQLLQARSVVPLAVDVVNGPAFATLASLATPQDAGESLMNALARRTEWDGRSRVR